jgi:hypothetical protein
LEDYSHTSLQTFEQTPTDEEVSGAIVPLRRNILHNSEELCQKRLNIPTTHFIQKLGCAPDLSFILSIHIQKLLFLFLKRKRTWL